MEPKNSNTGCITFIVFAVISSFIIPTLFLFSNFFAVTIVVIILCVIVKKMRDSYKNEKEVVNPADFNWTPYKDENRINTLGPPPKPPVPAPSWPNVPPPTPNNPLAPTPPPRPASPRIQTLPLQQQEPALKAGSREVETLTSVLSQREAVPPAPVREAVPQVLVREAVPQVPVQEAFEVNPYTAKEETKEEDYEKLFSVPKGVTREEVIANMPESRAPIFKNRPSIFDSPDGLKDFSIFGNSIFNTKNEKDQADTEQE